VTVRPDPDGDLSIGLPNLGYQALTIAARAARRVPRGEGAPPR
jgi:hypothetical protein